MTRKTHGVTGRPQRVRMRVVAIAAGHARGIHAALQKRPVHVDLIIDLPINVIQARRQQREPMGLFRIRPRNHRFGQSTTTAVAARTGIDLCLGPARLAALRATVFIGLPRHPMALREPDAKTLVQCGDGPIRFVDINSASLACACGRLRPRHMFLPWAMTALTGHIYFRVAGPISAFFGVVGLDEIGGMALGAHVVPVLVGAGPVQAVAGGRDRVGIQVEPALPASLCGAGVPRNVEGLQSPPIQRQQVLLQRIHAERVAHGEFAAHAIFPLGFDKEFTVAFEEAGAHPPEGDLGVLEIAEDRFRCGGQHGPVVMRPPPRRLDLGVTAAAGFRANETGMCHQGVEGSLCVGFGVYNRGQHIDRADKAYDQHLSEQPLRSPPPDWPAGGRAGANRKHQFTV